jgi:hypothetical protein
MFQFLAPDNNENQVHYGAYNLFLKKVQLQIKIQPVALKITSWRTMGKKKLKKHQNPMMCK